MAEPTWGVVATIDEPAELTIAFAAYHLGIGASEVHVFLDSPNPEAEAVLRSLPGCHVTTCDDAYWAATTDRKRYPLHTARQALNANRAYRETRVDWLLNSDADEFVRDGAWLAETLAGLSDEIMVLRLTTLERARLVGAEEVTIFDGVFRRPRGDFDSFGTDVYGRFAKFLWNGISGHVLGKGLVRTGQPIRLGIHFARWQEDRAEVDAVRVEPAQLLHFDGLTRLHFALKLLRRAFETPVKGHMNRHGDARLAQLRYMRNNATRSREVQRLTDGVQGLTEVQAGALEVIGALVRDGFDPRPVLAGMGVSPDLSPARFDAALRGRNAELITRSGLDF